MLLENPKSDTKLNKIVWESIFTLYYKNHPSLARLNVQKMPMY